MTQNESVSLEVEAILSATRQEHPRVTYQQLAEAGLEHDWPWWRINEWRTENDNEVEEES